MATETTCTTCRFFSPSSMGQANDLCKRYPPVMFKWPGHHMAQTTYPVVIGHYWCGEHQPRDDAGFQPASEEA